jgi:hypothetical protein
MSPVIVQIPEELIQAGHNTLHSEINKLINSIWSNKNCHSSRRIYYYTYFKEGDATG